MAVFGQGVVSYRRPRPSGGAAASPGAFPAFSPIVTPADSVTNFAASPTIFSAQSGAWSSPSTWGLGRVPQAGDVVGIRTTHTVTYDVNSAAAITAVGVAGSLVFRTDITTRLVVQTLLVYGPTSDGAWATYGYLEIGTAAAPVQAGVTATVEFPDAALIDANTGGVTNKQYSNGLLCWGKFRACGAAKTPFVRSSGPIAAGATTLNFASAQSGWVAGDRLLLPDSQPWTGVTEPASGVPWLYEVVAASLLTTTAATVGATAHAHPAATDYLGAQDFAPHVANLTRNVVLKSSNPDGVRGHTQYFYRCDCDARYARYESLGRTKNVSVPDTTTNQKGRYPVHFHHAFGPGGASGAGGLGYDAAVDPPEFNPADLTNRFTCLDGSHPNGAAFRLIGCVVEDTSATFLDMKWPVTLHCSSFGLVAGNVVYNGTGANLQMEEGCEFWNVIDGNLLCRCTGNGDRGDGGYNPAMTQGREGNGMSVPNATQWVRNNVVANVDGRQPGAGSGGTSVGYHYYNGNSGGSTTTQTNADGSAPAQVAPNFQGADPAAHGTSLNTFPVLQFRDNEVYTVGDGFTCWFIGSAYTVSLASATPPFPTSTLLRYNAWHTKRCVLNYPTANLTYDSCKWRQDFSLLHADGLGTQGFGSTDYMQRGMALTGCDIQGFQYGLGFPEKLGDATDPNSAAGGQATYANCLLVNYWNAYLENMSAVTGGGSSMTPRRSEYDGCTFVKPPLALIGGSENGTAPRKHFYRAWLTSPADRQNYNWVQLDRAVFSNCTVDGVGGQSFEDYADQQDGAFVTPQTVDNTGGHNVGSPVAGQTNTFNLANNGVCVAGQITPGGAAARADFDGKVL